MAFDEKLADRVRELLASTGGVEEKRMFGGLAFMVHGHMGCGLVGSRLMVRVDPGEFDRLVTEPHAGPMDFTGRPMRGFLFVEPAGTRTARGLKRWVDRAVSFASKQPPRKAKGKRSRP